MKSKTWYKHFFDDRLFVYALWGDHIAFGFSIGEVTYIRLGIIQLGFDWWRE
jgi:hypothetical protein